LGTRRIGIALSDSEGLLATPLCVLERSGNEQTDHAAIAAVVQERSVDIIVVGSPIKLDGSAGLAAAEASAETARLAQKLEIPVVSHDERLTTVEANRYLSNAGVSGRRRRKVVDMVAATVILQSWLDQQR